MTPVETKLERGAARRARLLLLASAGRGRRRGVAPGRRGDSQLSSGEGEPAGRGPWGAPPRRWGTGSEGGVTLTALLYALGLFIVVVVGLTALDLARNWRAYRGVVEWDIEAKRWVPRGRRAR